MSAGKTKGAFLPRLWYCTRSKPPRCIAQCLHWLMLPILWAFSATRAKTTRALVGGCRSSESAFRKNCAANSAGQREISGYGRTRLPSRTASCGKTKSSQIIAESVFFIPIITPTAIKSPHCKFEFDSFLAREKELGRSDLVFPILYIPVPALAGDRWRNDPLLLVVGSRQYEQWQNLRQFDPSSTEVALRVENFCANICREH
jgi:hypothetical protein